MKIATLPLYLAGRVPLFNAFRSRNYRLYWLGLLGMTSGNNVMLFTNLVVVNELTGSALYAGLVGGFYATGSLGFTMLGGVLADRINRRRLIMFTQGCWGLLNLVIGTLALTGVLSVWHVLGVSFLSGIIAGFDQPTRQALMPHLIEDRKHLPSAIAMTSIVWQSMRFVGPVFAGFLITMFKGPVPCYYFNAAAYAGMVLAISNVRVTRQAGGPTLGLLESMRQGIGYVVKSPVFSILIGTVLLDSLFGTSYLYMIPTFATRILKVDTQGVSYLMAAGGFGAMVGVLTAGSLGRFRHKGWLFLCASITFGTMLIAFSQSTAFARALPFVALADFFIYVYSVTVQTQLQMMVPDEVRGRVMGIYTLVWSLQPLGSTLTGAIGDFYSLPFAISLGGAIVSGFSLFVLLFVPKVRQLKV